MVDIDYELTNRILGLVRVQHLQYLGELIPSTYGFVGTDNPNGKVAHRNKRLHDKLLDGDAFHYKVCCTLSVGCF